MSSSKMQMWEVKIFNEDGTTDTKAAWYIDREHALEAAKKKFEEKGGNGFKITRRVMDVKIRGRDDNDYDD